MPVDEHAHEIPLTIHSTHMTVEDSQEESDDVYALSAGPQDVHFATIEEKKRLWFRDALINTLFIASWSVRNHRLSAQVLRADLYPISQVRFRANAVSVQQMDVRARTLRLPTSALCYNDTHVRSDRAGVSSALSVAA
jgi:hypothetical protein